MGSCQYVFDQIKFSHLWAVFFFLIWANGDLEDKKKRLKTNRSASSGNSSSLKTISAGLQNAQWQKEKRDFTFDVKNRGMGLVKPEALWVIIPNDDPLPHWVNLAPFPSATAFQYHPAATALDPDNFLTSGIRLFIPSGSLGRRDKRESAKADRPPGGGNKPNSVWHLTTKIC